MIFNPGAGQRWRCRNGDIRTIKWATDTAGDHFPWYISFLGIDGSETYTREGTVYVYCTHPFDLTMLLDDEVEEPAVPTKDKPSTGLVGEKFYVNFRPHLSHGERGTVLAAPVVCERVLYVPLELESGEIITVDTDYLQRKKPSE